MALIWEDTVYDKFLLSLFVCFLRAVNTLSSSHASATNSKRSVSSGAPKPSVFASHSLRNAIVFEAVWVACMCVD